MFCFNPWKYGFHCLCANKVKLSKTLFHFARTDSKISYQASPATLTANIRLKKMHENDTVYSLVHVLLRDLCPVSSDLLEVVEQRSNFFFDVCLQVGGKKRFLLELVCCNSSNKLNSFID